MLFTSVNLSGLFVRILTERAQRKAFLQARNCIEERLRMEDENEKQVTALISDPQGHVCPRPRAALIPCRTSSCSSFTCDLLNFALFFPSQTPSCKFMQHPHTHMYTFVGATADEPLAQERSYGDEGRLPETSRPDFPQDLHPAP